MTVGVSPNPAVVGQTVTISTNMNQAATGTVTFTDGSAVLGTGSVTSGAFDVDSGAGVAHDWRQL